MGLFEKDYILRLLEQLAQMLAAIRALVAGGRSREALASIEQARRTLAGPLAASLERLDAASVVSMLGREKAAPYAELARLESEARRAEGDEAAALRAAARADEIERAL
jgi:hypothetical protein